MFMNAVKTKRIISFCMFSILLVCLSIGLVAATSQDSYAATKTITKVKLNKSKFVQTDIKVPIKPKIKVYAGKKLLDAKRYKVTIYEHQFRGVMSEVNSSGKSITRKIYAWTRVKGASVNLGNTSYITFKVVVKGKKGYKGTLSKTFKVKSPWVLKKPNGWKAGENCERYRLFEGVMPYCIDSWYPVYTSTGKLYCYRTVCGRYTIKKGQKLPSVYTLPKDHPLYKAQ